MRKTVRVSRRDSSTQSEEIVDIPNKCVHCGNLMSPVVYYAYSPYSYSELMQSFALFVQCTDSDCSKYYALEYRYDPSSSNYYLVPYKYRPKINISLPENIEKVSPDFVTIYEEATKAESEGLNQISGVGYRKAVEFLIKDYSIRNNPDEVTKIKSMPLNQVINKYLSGFPKIQSLATAATWLGNDETHYVRTHTDKDIEDLKKFILATAQFIAADYDADVALKFTSKN